MSVNTTRQWAKAGVNARARSEAVRASIRTAVTADAVRGVEGVRFASPCARDLATVSRLTWAAFDGEIPFSVRGFTIADVRALLAFEDTDDD